MRFKKGVRTFIGIQPEITTRYPLIDRLCAEYEVEAVVTSGVEGRHKSGSKHYDGYAIDLRTREFEGGSMGEVCRSFSERLQAELGNDYFVLQESDHIHLDYRG